MMSTTKYELEQLRLARQQAREQEEQQKLEANAVNAAKQRRSSFLAKTSLFQKKAGPSEIEQREKIKSESAKRKFTKQLNKLLKEEPEKNRLALELNLKRGIVDDNTSSDKIDSQSDWKLIEEDGITPYYWNSKTNISTYDNPFTISQTNKPPPPPPPKKLIGIGSNKDTNWMKVISSNNMYYWNKVTDESTYDEPESYINDDDHIMYFDDDSNTNTNERCSDTSQEEVYSVSDQTKLILANIIQSGLTWQELSDDKGNTHYGFLTFNGNDGITQLNANISRDDRPDGVLYILKEPHVDNNGVFHNEDIWEEVHDSDGNSAITFYKSVLTAEIINDKPSGDVIIVESCN